MPACLPACPSALSHANTARYISERSSPLVIRVVAACEKVFPLCSTCVTFSLGFFLSTSYARWWKLRDLSGVVVGRTVDTMVMICTYLNGDDQKACDARRKLARYLLLAHAVSLQAGHRSFRPDKLIELGLIGKCVCVCCVCALSPHPL
jgi:predicted membrane chloride channel (bestrophin family)